MLAAHPQERDLPANASYTVSRVQGWVAVKTDLVVVRRGGVIAIPKSIREALGIEEGDVLRVSVEEGKIILSKESFWEKLFDSAKGLYSPDEAELELDEGEHA
jgi:AbrB family looped-hinge helix DNA binding protein